MESPIGPAARVVLSMVIWVAIGGAGVARAISIQQHDPEYCRINSDDGFGELAWSVVPPGPVCKYSPDQLAAFPELDATSGPGMAWIAWLIVLVVVATVSLREFRRWWTQQRLGSPRQAAP